MGKDTKMGPVAYVREVVSPSDMSFEDKIKAFLSPFADSYSLVGAVNPGLNSGYGIKDSNLVDSVLVELETNHSLNRLYVESSDYLGYGDLKSFETNTLIMAEAILNQNPDFDKLDVVELIAQTYKVLANYLDEVTLQF